MSKSLAFLDGWHVHKAGGLALLNPYNEFTQPRSHAAWSSGWCERYAAIKHELELTYDEEYE